MAQLNLTEAKTHFFEMIQKALLGEEMIITDEHRPLVKIVPLSAPESRRKPGSGTGQLLYMADDFDAPLEDFEEYQ
ncbi:type II toxin-antitoxin system Phd/YefM family antitoxin [Candidatus Electrothrix sp.]|uniref:type II toxin-antitoxin system Phd/YefM family antitoxin n=1 Tax=Candidatus Electrothrix sp. TaxID=2170559 RepID=UPI004055D66A